MKIPLKEMNTKLKEHNQWWILGTIMLTLLLIVRLHFMLADVRTEIRSMNENTKLTITEATQAVNTIDYITTLHQADGYALMLLQPKSSVKTYKECVFQHFESYDIKIPLKSIVDEPYVDLSNGCYKYKFPYQNTTLTVYVFPINKYRTTIGEVHLFYKTDPKPTPERLSKMRFDVQILGRFIE